MSTRIDRGTRRLAFCRAAGALALTLAAPAHAAGGKFYLEAVFGRAYAGEDTATVEQPPTTEVAEIDFEEALVAGLAFGIRVGRSWRVEGEYLYKTNDLERAVLPSGASFQAGDLSSVTISANAYYDFLPSRQVRPYLGLGVGWVQEVDIDFEDAGTETSYSNDAFAWQAMGGVRWDFARRWTLAGEIRVYKAGEVTMDEEGGPGRVTLDYDTLDLNVGVAFRF